MSQLKANKAHAVKSQLGKKTIRNTRIVYIFTQQIPNISIFEIKRKISENKNQ